MAKTTKKKSLTTLLVVVLLAVVAIGGMLAYLTDRDSEANVFTVGNVEIDLTEDFQQGATLTPGVDIEKKVVVKNTGKNEAWVWVKIAVPAALDNEDASKNVLHFNYSKEAGYGDEWTWKDAAGNWIVEEGKEINGVAYNEYVVLHKAPLAAETETTYPAMEKVYLDYHIDIDPNGDWYHVQNGVVEGPLWNVDKNGTPVIYVSAYAIQKEEFDDVYAAYAAYQGQWGDKGDEYAGLKVKDADALANALENGGYANVELEDDINADGVTVAADTNAIIDLGGKTLYTESGFVNNGEATIANGTINTTGNGIYGTRTPVGGETTYNDVMLVTKGGGVNVWGTAVWNGGDITTNSTSTSARHVFYVAGAEGAEGHLTINSGEFTFSPTNLTRKGSYICAEGADATVIVNGGTFHKPSTRTAPIQALSGATVTIYGGTFAFDPSGFVADGYQAVETSGVWTVSAK